MSVEGPARDQVHDEVGACRYECGDARVHLRGVWLDHQQPAAYAAGPDDQPGVDDEAGGDRAAVACQPEQARREQWVLGEHEETGQ